MRRMHCTALLYTLVLEKDTVVCTNEQNFCALTLLRAFSFLSTDFTQLSHFVIYLHTQPDVIEPSSIDSSQCLHDSRLSRSFLFVQANCHLRRHGLTSASKNNPIHRSRRSSRQQRRVSSVLSWTKSHPGKVLHHVFHIRKALATSCVVHVLLSRSWTSPFA